MCFSSRLAAFFFNCCNISLHGVWVSAYLSIVAYAMSIHCVNFTTLNSCGLSRKSSINIYTLVLPIALLVVGCTCYLIIAMYTASVFSQKSIHTPMRIGQLNCLKILNIAGFSYHCRVVDIIAYTQNSHVHTNHRCNCLGFIVTLLGDHSLLILL